jgi:transglutaminase-like putative cysteine protease
LFAAVALCALPALAAERTFTIRYSTKVQAPVGQRLDVWMPLPPSNDAQEVISAKVDAPFPGTEGTEPRFGNRFWHGHIEASDGKPVEITLVATVKRRAVKTDPGKVGSDNEYSAEERERLSRYLSPDARVPLKGEPLDKIDAELTKKLGPKAKDPAASARAIYDYVVDNMEYKKVGSGWGNGDTFWACSQKYGNCTDFHALFLSLARRRGIPGRFEMGFPIPADAKSGKVPGYHCWVEFWLPGRGWFPVDASEARKHPEQRDALFGGQPPDRVQLSEGRDLVLTGMHGEPLNYFVYPHVEIDAVAAQPLSWELTYEEPAAQSTR